MNRVIPPILVEENLTAKHTSIFLETTVLLNFYLRWES